MGITQKIALAAGLLGVVSGLLIGLVSIFLDGRNQIDTARSNADRILRATLPQIESAYWEVDVLAVKAIMAGLLEDPVIRAVRINDPLLTEDVRATTGLSDLSARETAQGAPSWVMQYLTSDEELSELEQYLMTSPRDGSEIGQLVAEYSFQSLYEDLVNQSLMILISSILQTLFVTVVILLAVQLTVIRPIAHLQSAALRVRDGKSFELRGRDRRMLDSSRRDEVSRLARAFHRTVTELENSRDNLQEVVDGRTKELIDARNEAQEASRAKSIFLANMSHELRTPLNAISGLADVLRREGSSEKSERNLADMQSAASHLSQNIESVLDLSKIEEGQLRLESVWFSLAGLLDDVVVQTRALMPNDTGVKFCLKYSDDLPTEIRSDPLRLRQILVNFASNAVKFTQKGSICFQVYVNQFHAETAELKFIIQDTGFGIPKAQLDGIFDPFGQAVSAISREFGGTGLGLSIAKRLTVLMHGEITVESTEGKGSAFCFQAAFPARDRSQKPSSVSGVFVRNDGGDIELVEGMFARVGVVLAPSDEDADCVVNVGPSMLTFNWPRQTSAMPKNLEFPITHQELLATLSTSQKWDSVAANAAVVLRNRNVLIVEDNRINRRVFESLVGMLGAKTQTAENGVEALKLIAVSMPDVVLMDLRMPIMDGHQALERLREIYGTSLPPVIAMSAEATPEEENRCIAAGFVRFLPKPVNPIELREALVAALDKEPNAAINERLGKHFAGEDHELFVRNLSKFREKLKVWKQQAVTLVDTKNAGVESDLLHVIKGVAGTVGATRLVEVTKKIDCGDLRLNDLITEIEILEMDPILRSVESKRKTSLLDHATLDKLANRIDAREISAVDTIRAVHADPQNPHQDLIKQKLEQSLHRFEFSAAKTLLTELRGTIQKD